MERDNKEIEIAINEVTKDLVVPTAEEAAESMCEILHHINRGQDYKYLCYCEGCPNRIKDKPINEYEDLIDEYQGFEDEEDIKFKKNENKDCSNNKEAPLMENLDDIVVSILSDIYGG